VPAVNQIELHPWCQQRELVKYCQDNNIVIQAYSPLATGARLADPTVCSVAEKHKRSPAQVLIRYSLQKGWVPLPKTENPGRMRENLDVFTFELDDDDMQLLDGLDEAKDGAMFPVNVTG
jgi:diketogulonate reductase-like aldo/keto reductase